jgi:GNAT superfamily N-acetyltransferase
MTTSLETVAVRWARAEDAELPFVASGIPKHVIVSRITHRCLAVAELGGVPIGAVHLEYLWGIRPYIAMIRVVPDRQRGGVGRALLAFIEAWLRAQGYRELLSSSQANEPEPQAWHRHLGFTDCGILEGINEGGIDEIFFRKPLVP